MANGLVNYNILKPELATSFAQGFEEAQLRPIRQKAAEQQIKSQETTMQYNQEKLAQLRQEREQMLKLQKDLAAKGQNPDLDFVFDTMVSSGIPDYVTKGLEGKRKLDEQRNFARIMGFDTGAAAPSAPAVPNALAGGLPPPPAPATGEGMTPVPSTPTPAAAAPTPAAAAPTSRNALTPDAEIDRLNQQINGLLQLGTQQARDTAQILQARVNNLQKPTKPSFMAVGRESTVFDPETRSFIAPPRVAGAGGVEPPKLKQGERWNEAKQRVEAVEGSDIYKKQRSDFTKEYKSATSTIDKMDEGIRKIDELLDPKNIGGFEGNFGGPGAYATRLLPGENTDFRKKIDSFKSTLKSAGLELIRAGGAIGQMTVQEWPIVEQMIDAISPELSEEQAKASFNEIRARFQRISDRAKDVYETEYADSQFYKPIKSLTGGGGAGQTPIYATNPKTGERIMSTDGGNNWTPAR